MGFFSKSNDLSVELAEITRHKYSLEAVYKAFSLSMAMIEFSPEGRVLTANHNFLQTMEYSLQEIVGKHHSLFCKAELVNSAEYKDFWKELANGKATNGEFLRVTHSGKNIWLAASYCPVLDQSGQVEKVIKIASDMTQTVESMHELKAQSEAVSRSMATIEFDINGNILSANDNFYQTMGYTQAEIIGKHHKMFCTAELSRSDQYRQFWHKLNSGEFISGRFERINKNGDSVWLDATYNPIFNTEGQLYKIIKFATDHTASVEAGNKTSELVYQSSIKTDDISTKGNDIVTEAIAAMQKVSQGLSSAAASIDSLSQQSEQISNIVNTITSIADQTNLLALNAAIEAARAGEQGRGFAVVADEVRQLAGRTSKSTAEIDEVVKENNQLSNDAVQSMQQIVELAEQGMNLVQKTGEAITEISDSTREMVEVVSKMSKSD
nr:PAS domain-containing methyl-accepting chemotaxis protein [Paraglaciecola sp. G1-23]